MNEDLNFEFIVNKAKITSVIQTWCSTTFSWNECGIGEEAGTLILREKVNIKEYDRFCFTLTCSDELDLNVSLRIDDYWTKTTKFSSEKRRFEIILPINGMELTDVKVKLVPGRTGAREISFAWMGIIKEGYEMSSDRGTRNFDPKWKGLIKNEDDWGEIKFACGILFDESKLKKLRLKRELPYRDIHYKVLKEAALETMTKNPESLIGKFIPWSDGRYQFSYEITSDIYFFEPLTLAIVGLVEEDKPMLKMALRYLMSYLYTEHWTQSENVMAGVTWDQRCFLEEMSVSCVAMLADWLHFAITDHARELICKSIWDKGLSVIDRDLMKYEHMWTMNQGPWFCRARILGGLLLEISWPKIGNYVERAYKDMIEMLNNYILVDEGTDEGVGYFSLTMGVCLEGLFAYSKSKNIDIKSCLPKNIDACEAFISTLSGIVPGSVLMDGDNSFERFIGNAIPFLATIYPDSNYSKITGNLLGHKKPETYYSQYVPNMELSFVLGPDLIPTPETIVPTFNILEHTGHLTSFRKSEDLSVRIHLAGAKAFASHTHFDKGSFTLEINSHPVLIDRGVIRYDDPSGGNIKATECHNAITPTLKNGLFPVQKSLTEAIIPSGFGNSKKLNCSIDINNVWQDFMISAKREIISENINDFIVIDSGTLIEEGLITFHLNSLYKLKIYGEKVFIQTDAFTLNIQFDYAESIKTYVHMINHEYRPVYHLEVQSGVVKDFNITTKFNIAETL